MIGEGLDANMVRAGIEVLSYAISDSVRFAPGHDRIDESVASSSGQILVSEPEPAEVVGVVREGEIARGECPGRLVAPCLGSSSSTTVTSGASSAPVPSASRARLVCSTGTK